MERQWTVTYTDEDGFEMAMAGLDKESYRMLIRDLREAGRQDIRVEIHMRYV